MVSVTESDPRPSVELTQITKSFPGVIANDRIDLAIHAGEIHSLLGENGAGKSTLIGILSGMVTPDSGEILVDGEPAMIYSPKDALDLGIGTVYQHSLLVPTLTILDNMMLGTAKRLTLDRSGAIQRITDISTLLDVTIDPDAVVGDLSLGEQQQVEIIRALWRGQRALILDEPTSMLTPRGVESLGRVLRRLTDNGMAIVFITHKLEEAVEFGDRVTVLRRGRNVGEVGPAAMRDGSATDLKAHIIDLIFGSSATDAQPLVETQRMLDEQPVSLRVKDVGVTSHGPRPLLDAISFEVRRGEIFGIAGIDGNGQKELAEVISGQRRLDHGQILFEDKPVQTLSVAARQDLGIRYVTDDRHGEGTVGPMSIAINTVMKRIGQRPFWRRANIRHALIREFATTLIDEHDVRTPHEQVPIATLSGGNMQKVLVGRELAMGPKAVVFNKPTYGLDVKTMKAVLAHIVAQSEQGTAVILISTELSELISTCDRIAVMYQGRITGILESRPGIETQLGELMTGAAAA